MDFALNQKILVKDSIDGNLYSAKILSLDSEKKEIKIHFINWADRYDEILPFDSDRIGNQKGEDIIATDSSKQSAHTSSVACPIKTLTQEVLGNLLKNSNQSQKVVLSAFNEDDSFVKNEKSLNKFLVPQLEETAEFLKIKIVSAEGSKMYLKNPLIRKIVGKIMSLLPAMCLECGSTYAAQLGAQSIFNCVKCDRSSHDCSKIISFHKLLTDDKHDSPLGLVWICSPCLKDLRPDTLSPVQHSSSERNSVPTDIEEVPLTDSDADSAVAKPINNKNLMVVNNNKEASSVKICGLYRRGACPHGLRGTKEVDGEVCKLPHPKVCQKYISFGSREEKGCSFKDKCSLFHPILCRYSVKSRFCANEKCTFAHLKGTRRQKPEQLQLDSRTTGTSVSRKVMNGSKNSQPNGKDPIERLQEMIKEMRAAQLQEMTYIKQEITYLKGLNPLSKPVGVPHWSVPPPYQYQPMMPNHATSQMYPQNHYLQGLPNIYQNEQFAATKMGQQQMGGPPPEKSGGNSSYF